MRIDLYLFQNKFTKSRQQSKNLIENKKVLVDGVVVQKPSSEIDENEIHEVCITETQKYVGRGGEKLETAIDTFKVDVKDKICIDIGASTGGFTDCLLQNGALTVYAIDSGFGQLDKKLLDDKRVLNFEKCNARFLSESSFNLKFDIAVMDVSFISQTLLHQNVSLLLKEDGEYISLIKPQFECGKSSLSKNGIVKDKKKREMAVSSCIQSAIKNGFSLLGLVKSKIAGGDGNIEYLAYFKKSKQETDYLEIITKLFTEEK